MPKLIAVKRSLYYGGREHHVGGDAFDATEVDGRYLIKIGRAELYEAPPAPAKIASTRPAAETKPESVAEVDVKPIEVTPVPESDDLSALTRPKLIELARKKGIDVETDDSKADLLRKVSEGTYHRRDLRAED